jgi:lipopolysaccharide/colanic/teichoic acid biosynthesis glycosyltransferase
MHRSRLPASKNLLKWRITLFDVAAGAVAPILAILIRNLTTVAPLDVGSLIFYSGVSAALSVWFFNVFRVAHGLSKYFSYRDAIGIAKASACAAAGAAAVSFTLTRLNDIPRSVPAIHFILLFSMLAGARLLRRSMAHRHNFGAAADIAHGDERSVILVGAGRLAWFYARLLDSFAIDNRRIAAVLDDDRKVHGRSVFGHVIVGGTPEAAALLDDFAMHGVNISGFIICERDQDRAYALRDRLEPLCAERGLRLELLAEQLGVFSHEAKETFSEAADISDSLPNIGYLRAKRVIDATLVSCAVIVCLPLFAIAGLLVLIDMGSPVIFWQRRIGREGRAVYVHKFKTMRNPIDNSGGLLSDNERRSRIGQFMRVTRLDELPQLYDVIKGDMGLVGPRPLLPADQPEGPSLRLAVAPGLTGWAQIHGGKLITAEEKNELDEWYVRNASLPLDIKIMLRTILIVLVGDKRNEQRIAAALALAAEDKQQRAPLGGPSRQSGMTGAGAAHFREAGEIPRLM